MFHGVLESSKKSPGSFISKRVALSTLHGTNIYDLTAINVTNTRAVC